MEASKILQETELLSSKHKETGRHMNVPINGIRRQDNKS